MTHTREERIADRPGHLCAGYGCPLLGVMSSSTTGTNEWWCFAHYGKDAGRIQRITAELRRLDWLTQAITDVRTRSQNPNYGAAYQRICHDFKLAQRSDLLWTSPESDEQWMVRLEQEVVKLLATDTPPPKQAPLVTEQPADTFSRVGFDMPA